MCGYVNSDAVFGVCSSVLGSIPDTQHPIPNLPGGSETRRSRTLNRQKPEMMRRFGDHISEILADEEWALYRSVMMLAIERGISFAIGGGMAFSAYSGRY